MTWVYRPKHPKANCNGMVDACFAEFERVGTAPHVISDEMPPTRHMADNKYYTSKAKFRAATRAAGCIEYGTETATLLKPRKPIPLDRQKRRDDIKRALWEVRNGQGYKPGKED